MSDSGPDLGGEFPFEFDAEDQFFHLHEFGVVGVVVAVKHPADEMGDDVFPARTLVFELAEEVDVELLFLLGGGELGELVDPALVALEALDLLFP